jgi:microcystin-dependent protein
MVIDKRLYTRILDTHGEKTRNSRYTLPADSEDCRQYLITLPASGDYLAALNGALGMLADIEHYYPETGGAAAAAAQNWQQIIIELNGGHGEVTRHKPGDIKLSFGDQTEQWLACDGGEYPIDEYGALYDAIGDTFGAAGSGMFRVPDMREKFPLGGGGDISPGDTGGEAEHTLTTAEIPAHNHAVEVPAFGAGLIGEIPASTVDINPFGSTGNTGGGEPHNNMPPYIGVNYWIYTGIPECIPCEPFQMPELPPPGPELIFESTSQINGDVILPITSTGFYRIDMRGLSNAQGTGWTFVSARPQAGTLAAWREWTEGFASLSFGTDENAQTSTFIRAWLPETGAPGPTRLMNLKLWLEVAPDRLYAHWNTAVVQSAAAAGLRMGAMQGQSISTYSDLSAGIRILTTGEVARWHKIHVWKDG